MYLQRKTILAEIVSQLEKEVLTLQASKKNTETASKEAASSIEAMYDARKEEMAQLARAQKTLISETEATLATIKNIANLDLPIKLVKEGNIALLKNLSSEQQNLYLLCESGGGKKFDASVGQITLVTPGSSFGGQLKDKMLSQIVTINSARFVVLQIF